jgi:hypothetical protein
VRYRDGLAQPRHKGAVGTIRRCEFVGPLSQLVKAFAEQGLEQRFSRRKVAVQRAKPHARFASDVAQRRVGTLSGDNVARDGEQPVVVLLRVSSHRTP